MEERERTDESDSLASSTIGKKPQLESVNAYTGPERKENTSDEEQSDVDCIRKTFTPSHKVQYNSTSSDDVCYSM